MNISNLRKKPLILTVSLALVVASGGLHLYKKNNTAEKAFKEVKPTRTDLEVTILSTGVVQPENRVEIKPPIAGRVEEVLVKEGVHLKRGQLLAWMSSTERAALLDAARSKGPEELQKWQGLYRPTPVLAPINGTLILRNIEPGQTFTAQDSIFVMSDRLTIKAQVDETDIAQIKLKQKAAIILDAYAKQNIEAHVDQIAFEAKTVNNVTTYIVDVLPDTTPEYMRSGMTANVTFYVAAKENALVVPTEALKMEKGKFIVLSPSQDRGPPKEIPLEIGITDGKRTEILSGLTEQDTILVPVVKTKSDRGNPSSPFSPMGGSRPRSGGGAH
ncbi:HlyD family efflux transporter periplasmic adaptor subunit [Bdellovibrionota bacterium FG-2]